MTTEEQAAVDAVKKGPATPNKSADAAKKVSDDKATAPATEPTDEEKEAAQQEEITKTVEAKRTAELLAANDKVLPPGFLQPTVGRIIHFFPNPNDKQALENGVEFIAGIVIRVFGNHRADIRIFPVVEEKARFIIRWNVPHKIKAGLVSTEDEGYWDWPARA